MMSLLSFGADGWGRLILSAAGTTLLLSLAALMIGAVVGSGVGAAKLSHQRWLRWLGFQFSDPISYGVDGLPFLPFYRRRGA